MSARPMSARPKSRGSLSRGPFSRRPGAHRAASPPATSSSGVRVAVLLVLALVAAVAFPERNASAVDATTIYDDALASDYQNWSWASTELASTDEAFSGSSAVAVSYGPWESVYFARPEPEALSPNAIVEFWMHGGDGPAGDVLVILTDGNQTAGPGFAIQPEPGTWTKYSVPVRELGSPSQLGGIWWQDGTGVSRSTMYLDEVRLVEGEPPATEQGPALTVDTGTRSLSRTVVDPASGIASTAVVEFPHAISDGVYGLNFAAPSLRDELSPGVNRWGGNAVERFNHLTGATNLGSDYFFMTNPGAGPGDDHDFENANQASGTATLLTVPATGWVERGDEPRCGYPLSEYDLMDESAAHWLDPTLVCGNGKRSGVVVSGTPQTTSIAVGPAFTQDWVSNLVATHGSAAAGGVETYAIGNEPGLWHNTHSDVVSTPMTRQAIIDTNLSQAAAIKAADPSAAVAGPVLWSGYSYYVTSAEFDAGQRPGDVPTFVEEYLVAMAQGGAETGQRLLDTLAINFYDDRVYWGGSDELRLESTRSLWDPTYAPQDWWVVRDFVGEGSAVIPRMQSLIDNNYPGTNLAITEYNFGALDTVAGGLTQADVLGIFGREGLDAAMLWDPFNAQLSPPIGEFSAKPAMWAFRMFRNYDGAGSQFGDQSLFAASDDQATLSVYASSRSTDQAITVMVINKSLAPQSSTLDIAGVAGSAEVFRYDGSDLIAINQLADVSVADEMTMTYPARSITLLVIDPNSEPEPTATLEPEPTATPEPEPTATSEPEPTATPEPEPTATPEPEPTATPEPEPTATSEPEPTATPEPEPTATSEPEPTATPEAEPTATPEPEPTATSEPEPEPTATPEPEPEPTVGPCVPGVPAGAIEGQPEFVGCRALGSGVDTAVSGPNSWLDEFDHGQSLAMLDVPSYRVFDGLDLEGTVHWQHADHWMVDVAINNDVQTTGGAMLSPVQTFRFEDGTLIVEADTVAGHPDYIGAWPELVITTAAAPSGPRYASLYGYDWFPDHYTLGCRLQLDTATICAFMDQSNGGSGTAGRIWEMSWFQQVGEEVFGGNGFVDNGEYYRLCAAGAPDTECRDRFRLELTATSLTIYVNGLLYFEQTGIEALPAEFLDGDLHVYFASMVSRHNTDAVRFHWDRLAVNPGTGPSASPTWPG